LGLLAIEMVHHHHAGRGLLASFILWHVSYLSTSGLWYMLPMHCRYPVVLRDGVRLVLTIATVVSLVAILMAILGEKLLREIDSSTSEVRSWHEACFPIVPFTWLMQYCCCPAA
jgi:hypothetical protein